MNISIVECRDRGSSTVMHHEFKTQEEMDAFVQRHARVEIQFKRDNRTITKVVQKGTWDYMVQRHEVRENNNG